MTPRERAGVAAAAREVLQRPEQERRSRHAWEPLAAPWSAKERCHRCGSIRWRLLSPYNRPRGYRLAAVVLLYAGSWPFQRSASWSLHVPPCKDVEFNFGRPS